MYEYVTVCSMRSWYLIGADRELSGLVEERERVAQELRVGERVAARVQAARMPERRVFVGPDGTLLVGRARPLAEERVGAREVNARLLERRLRQRLAEHRRAPPLPRRQLRDLHAHRVHSAIAAMSESTSTCLQLRCLRLQVRYGGRKWKEEEGDRRRQAGRNTGNGIGCHCGLAESLNRTRRPCADEQLRSPHVRYRSLATLGAHKQTRTSRCSGNTRDSVALRAIKCSAEMCDSDSR